MYLFTTGFFSYKCQQSKVLDTLYFYCASFLTHFLTFMKRNTETGTARCCICNDGSKPVATKVQHGLGFDNVLLQRPAIPWILYFFFS